MVVIQGYDCKIFCVFCFLPLNGFISAQLICETLINQYSAGSLCTTIAIFKGFSWFGFTATTAEKVINFPNVNVQQVYCTH